MKRLLLIALTLSLLVLSAAVSGQDHHHDLELINQHHQVKDETDSLNSTRPISLTEKSLAVRLNPAGWVLNFSMFAYQNVFSPQLSAECPFEISCSNFAKHCIVEYGFLKGVSLAADRLMRCNNFYRNDLPLYYLNEAYKVIDPPNAYRFESEQ